jgi:hypothetical protein
VAREVAEKRLIISETLFPRLGSGAWLRDKEQEKHISDMNMWAEDN